MSFPTLPTEVLQKTVATPESRAAIVHEFCAGKRVLHLGCVQHDLSQVAGASWIHTEVVNCASSCVGVDYLEAAVSALRESGLDVVHGDVTKPLPLSGPFDVILAGNLIEHLSNFEGLFANFQRLLAPGGVVLISTANPFFREQYFYTAFRNRIVVNQEHTCWIDPVTLAQLSSRFSFFVREVRWVSERWRLSDAIFHSDSRRLDNFTGKWHFANAPSGIERFVGAVVESVLKTSGRRELAARIRETYGVSAASYLTQRAGGIVLELAWSAARALIPSSDLNEHELYVAVLAPVKAKESDSVQ